jgi:Ca2+-binding RTX toxin-like protein
LLSSKGVTIANTSANETVTGTINKDTMYITGDNKTVYADAGDDYIWVKGSANTIHGGDGDDEININNSNSVIYGEKGNDYICIGWEYDDSVTNTTCIFNNGDGNDIVDTCNDVTLKFLDSLMSDLTYTQNGNDLIIGYSSKDTVTLRDYFYIESEADDYSTSHNIEIVCKDTVTSHKLVLNGVETTIETQIDINGLQQETASFESQSLSDAIMVADDVPSDSATAVIAQYTPEQPQTM